MVKEKEKKKEVIIISEERKCSICNEPLVEIRTVSFIGEGLCEFSLQIEGYETKVYRCWNYKCPNKRLYQIEVKKKNAD